MKFSDQKKTAILQLLIHEARPVSLQELLAKLGGDYTERTLRRWLSGLADEGLVDKLGQKRASKYQATQKKTLFQKRVPSLHFSAASLEVLQQIRRPIYERIPVPYKEGWFNSYQPNKTFYLPLDLRTQLEQVGKRSKKEDPAGTYAHQIFNRLLIDLSYNSSRLEGNTYSLLDTQRLLFEGTSAEGKLDEENHDS